MSEVKDVLETTTNDTNQYYFECFNFLRLKAVNLEGIGILSRLPIKSKEVDEVFYSVIGTENGFTIKLLSTNTIEPGLKLQVVIDRY